MAVREATSLWSEGYHIGQTVTDKLGFWGVSPVVQPSASGQAAVSITTLAAVTTTTPAITQFGFSSAQAADVLRAINDLVTRANSMGTVNNAMQSALVSIGILKGSA